MPPLTSPEGSPVREGEILDGKYRVERVLGVGGMGVVVAATHVQLQTRVALKFLLPTALGIAQVVQRFAREARAAVQIQSEHVARVIDVGTLPSGSPYMVMEYLEGGDLADAVAKGGPMPVARAVGYLLQACEAIAEAHALGIVHRDLKPANLFLARRAGRDSIVKVLDFGISKTNELGPSGLTQTSNVMGSPQYMSPEQMMSSKNVDARADVWALGVILYELLTGGPPFVAETMAEIVYMVTQRDAPSLLAKRPDAPPALSEAIARALARDPEQRIANVAVLARAIVAFGPPRSEISIERIARVLGATEPAASPEPAPSPEPPKAPSQPTLPALPPGRATSATDAELAEDLPASSRKGPLLVAAIAAAVLLIAVVSWRALRGHAEPAAARPEAVVVPHPAAPIAPAAPAAAPPPQTPPPVAPSAAAVATPPATVPSPGPAAPSPARHAAHVATKPARSHGPAPASHLTTAAPAPEPPPAAPARRGLDMGLKE